MDFELSRHTQNVLKERCILEKWVWQTIEKPDWENVSVDSNIHYFKKIDEHEGRILHVIVNPHVSPKKVVTVFFDRRASKEVK
uniref:DUF4258 domain-containing protein n=1 Tax=candidate division WOR-3 bacterium TaxID=2052148 RepID=A0A7V1EI23_UNCW3